MESGTPIPSIQMTLASLNRWKAAAIHLGLSVLIAATVVTVMLLVWYTPPYFDTMGGTGLLKILVGVDVTLGPLLTLIIFDPRKKGLRFDLSVIAALPTNGTSSCSAAPQARMFRSFPSITFRTPMSPPTCGRRRSRCPR